MFWGILHWSDCLFSAFFFGLCLRTMSNISFSKLTGLGVILDILECVPDSAAASNNFVSVSSLHHGPSASTAAASRLSETRRIPDTRSSRPSKAHAEELKPVFDRVCVQPASVGGAHALPIGFVDACHLHNYRLASYYAWWCMTSESTPATSAGGPHSGPICPPTAQCRAAADLLGVVNRELAADFTSRVLWQRWGRLRVNIIGGQGCKFEGEIKSRKEDNLTRPL